MRQIESITAVADLYDVIVFDQWGVLHNGSAPYPFAVQAVRALQTRGCTLAVLSNSGKSGDVNRQRITSMGFAADAFGIVMTSGEALRRDIQQGALSALGTLLALTAAPGDAGAWAGDLPLTFTQDLAKADAVLLMGLPDGDAHVAEREVLEQALTLGKPLICSNPDRTSPRADGVLVVSPGALAHAYQDAGGTVLFYGKPHRPVFDALLAQIGPVARHRILMVGDSPEHDIAGAKGAGWDTLFINGGIHAGADVASLFGLDARPTYTMTTLR